MKIGVFDSGVGGESVAKTVSKAFPDDEIIYREDRANVPYGSKTAPQLLVLVKPILQHMVDEGCGAIVIACNTVTTTIISQLRATLTVPLIGIEPMIKPAAALTTSLIIAVCATPTTLASPRYAELKQLYAPDITVLEPDCSDWSSMIEAGQISHEQIEARITEVCKAGADVIVLGCTHYHWISDEIDGIARHYGARVIHPEQPVVQQLKHVLERSDG